MAKIATIFGKTTLQLYNTLRAPFITCLDRKNLYTLSFRASATYCCWRSGDVGGDDDGERRRSVIGHGKAMRDKGDEKKNDNEKRRRKIIGDTAIRDRNSWYYKKYMSARVCVLRACVRKRATRTGGDALWCGVAQCNRENMWPTTARRCTRL